MGPTEIGLLSVDDARADPVVGARTVVGVGSCAGEVVAVEAVGRDLNGLFWHLGLNPQRSVIIENKSIIVIASN